MLQDLKRLWQETDGQSMAEYGLLTALIALVCLAGVRLLGQALQDKFNLLATEIGTP